jgi:hypothetical protein
MHRDSIRSQWGRALGVRSTGTVCADVYGRLLGPFANTRAVIRVFNSGWRAVFTTDASNVAVAATSTQPDGTGLHHLVAYKDSKLTAAERNCPARVLELLAVVLALLVFKNHLRGSGAPLQ